MSEGRSESGCCLHLITVAFAGCIASTLPDALIMLSNPDRPHYLPGDR